MTRYVGPRGQCRDCSPRQRCWPLAHETRPKLARRHQPEDLAGNYFGQTKDACIFCKHTGSQGFPLVSGSADLSDPPCALWGPHTVVPTHARYAPLALPVGCADFHGWYEPHCVRNVLRPSCDSITRVPTLLQPPLQLQCAPHAQPRVRQCRPGISSWTSSLHTTTAHTRSGWPLTPIPSRPPPLPPLLPLAWGVQPAAAATVRRALGYR